jgi:hypothetical protein
MISFYVSKEFPPAFFVAISASASALPADSNIFFEIED